MKKHLAITEIEIPETEVSGDEEEEEESTELPEITPEMQKQISQSLSSPPNVTLVECYRYVEFAKTKKVPKSDPNSKIGFFEFWVGKTLSIRKTRKVPKPLPKLKNRGFLSFGSVKP